MLIWAVVTGCISHNKPAPRGCGAVATPHQVFLSFVHDTLSADAVMHTDPRTTAYDVLSLQAPVSVMDLITAHTVDRWPVDDPASPINALIFYFTYDTSSSSGGISIQSLAGVSVYRRKLFTMVHTFYQQQPDGQWAEISELSGYISTFFSKHPRALLNQVLHPLGGRPAYMIVTDARYQQPRLLTDQLTGRIDRYVAMRGWGAVR